MARQTFSKHDVYTIYHSMSEMLKLVKIMPQDEIIEVLNSIIKYCDKKCDEYGK
jgi:hypothetical protein